MSVGRDDSVWLASQLPYSGLLEWRGPLSRGELRFGTEADATSRQSDREPMVEVRLRVYMRVHTA